MKFQDYSPYSYGIYFDGFQLEEGSTATEWVVGGAREISLNKKIFKPLSVWIESTVNSSKAIKKAIDITVNTSASISKAISKSLDLIIKLGVNTKRSITKALKAIVNVLVNVYKYWQVYPKLSFTEYKIDMDITEYPIEMEVKGMATAGSTITLTGKFPTSAGDLTQLTDVTLKIYAPSKVLLETIIPSETDTGVYAADYTIPEDKYGQFDYEFSGKLWIRTITSRNSFDSHWRE